MNAYQAAAQLAEIGAELRHINRALDLSAWIRCTNGQVRCPACGYVFDLDQQTAHAAKCNRMVGGLPAGIDVRAELGGRITG